MGIEKISSPHSPHVARVRALLGSRGKKERAGSKEFVLEGRSALIAALNPQTSLAPKLEKIYLTETGADLLADIPLTKSGIKIYTVSDAVMKQMADTETPQGILGICSFRENTLHRLTHQDGNSPMKLAFFWEMQDPGNCGTVIRAADAAGFDGIMFSTNSVDIYSPKAVRATAGSLWNIPVIQDVSLEEILDKAESFSLNAFDSHAKHSFDQVVVPDDKGIVLIFGNEARGLPSNIPSEMRVQIPMRGHTESMNVASAAAIAMYHFGRIA